MIVYFLVTIMHPQLEFTDKNIVDIVKNLIENNTLIITDSYNYSNLKNVGTTILVKNSYYEQINKIKEKYDYSNILAIGGCTALDIGRACAIGKEIINIPTILSTSCISVDRSVIRYEKESKLEKTIAPSKTIISVPFILKTESKNITKWSQSGFGDLFANISASIDFQYKEKNISCELVKKNVPECFEALNWVINSFQNYDIISLTKLAKYLHNSSLTVIKRNDTLLSSAGEHKLYYKIIEQQKQYTNNIPTHGQLVAIGTLISIKIFSKQMKDNLLYEKIKMAYKKLRLPLNYKQLENIGIKRSYLIQGLNSITNTNTYLGDYFSNKNYKIIDEIFK